MKKKRAIAFLLFLLTFPVLVHAQADKEVKFSDLNFKNEAEKSAFLKLEEERDTTDVWDLFFTSYDKSVMGNKDVALKKVNECVSYLKPQIENKPDVKKIKIVYAYVHMHFLKVYKLKNSFIQIFENGEYNCLSATALYSIIFSKLSIPFQIKERPTHVYLVAYPNSAKILIETTDPQKGYYQFTGSFVTKYVTTLYNSKLITKEEFESNSANDLFNKYYFSSENISIMNLAGLQFSNFSAYQLEEENLISASEEAKKAYFILPNQRNKYILMAILLSQITKSGYEELVNISNLVLVSKLNDEKLMDISNLQIREEFTKIIQTQLIKNSDYEKFDKSYLILTNELTDTTLKRDIGFMYHMELARLAYLGSKSNEEVIQHLYEAYRFNSLDANMRALVSAIFEKSIYRYNDAQRILEKTEEFAKKFPFFKEGEYYIDLKARCKLDLAYRSFYLGDLNKGENYLKEFEVLVKENKAIQPMEDLVERAYGQAAGEYFKRGNQTKAKQVVRAGLVHAPTSFGLQQRLTQLK